MTRSSIEKCILLLLLLYCKQMRNYPAALQASLVNLHMLHRLVQRLEKTK